MSKAQKPFIINLGIFSLITVIIWIIYSLYSAFSRPANIDIPESDLVNFDTTLDPAALSRLQESIYLSEEELSGSVTIVTPETEPEQQDEVIEEIPANEQEP